MHQLQALLLDARRLRSRRLRANKVARGQSSAFDEAAAPVGHRRSWRRSRCMSAALRRTCCTGRSRTAAAPDPDGVDERLASTSCCQLVTCCAYALRENPSPREERPRGRRPTSRAPGQAVGADGGARLDAADGRRAPLRREAGARISDLINAGSTSSRRRSSAAQQLRALRDARCSRGWPTRSRHRPVLLPDACAEITGTDGGLDAAARLRDAIAKRAGAGRRRPSAGAGVRRPRATCWRHASAKMGAAAAGLDRGRRRPLQSPRRAPRASRCDQAARACGEPRDRQGLAKRRGFARCAVGRLGCVFGEDVAELKAAQMLVHSATVLPSSNELFAKASDARAVEQKKMSQLAA